MEKNKNKFRLSDHALKGHEDEKWNARTILEARKSGQFMNLEWVFGSTADCFYFIARDGETVGLIVSKEKGVWEKYRVVITGFAAPAEYWEAQGK